MRKFDQQLLRLKSALGISSDQEIAALLGMSKAAFSDRKKRDAFPEDKLLALVTRRPDLVVSPDYVLTGKTEKERFTEVHQRPPIDYAELAKWVMGGEPLAQHQNSPTSVNLSADEQVLLDAYRSLSAAKRNLLLAELLTGSAGKKPAKAGDGVVVCGSGNRTAGRNYHEKE